MKNEKRKTFIANFRPLSFTVWFYLLSFSFLSYLPNSACWAVTSKITRHTSSADFLKGQAEDVVISSRGTVQLGRVTEVLAEQFEDVWSINSIVTSGGQIYLGTSPNGDIYEYYLGKLKKIYPKQPQEINTDQVNTPPRDPNQTTNQDQTTDANTNTLVETEQYLSNEHIFVMATDVAGRLLAGISGDKCKLVRLEMGEMVTIFEPNDTMYIFAIALNQAGDIYLGTGPNGKVYKLDPFGKHPQVVYETSDKNILSLAIGNDGFVYAGTDTRGLVYRIDPHTKKATVLYDSDQPEITALLFADDEPDAKEGSPNLQKNYLYAAATSAKVVQAQTKFAKQLPFSGRPETESPEKKDAEPGQGGLKLKTANTKQSTKGKAAEKKISSRKEPKPTEASHIYKINSEGYVTDIFSEAAVFFSLAADKQTLFVGTGNSAQLFAIDTAAEQEQIIYEDQQASQITAVIVDGEDVYLGTANPAKLIKLGKTFATEGTYTSDLIDADQPAKWGKLQIEADIPEGCKIYVASRSGNVKDINDPTFTDWTELLEVTEPIQLRCPPGRFCQYKLVLKTNDGTGTPVLREVAVASTVPNLAPKVETVTVGHLDASNKAGIFKISYGAKDGNGDKLIYTIDFRKIGRTNWIQIKDELEPATFEWDGRTVEDGRYEIRVTASDERSNTPETRLTASRISDPVVVDNTGPTITKTSLKKDDKAVTLKLLVSDQLSAIGKVQYTVDSNADWIGAVPDDLVFDTTDENFTIVVKDLEAGEHVISVKVTDDVDNATYKTFEIGIDGN